MVNNFQTTIKTKMIIDEFNCRNLILLCYLSFWSHFLSNVKRVFPFAFFPIPIHILGLVCLERAPSILCGILFALIANDENIYYPLRQTHIKCNHWNIGEFYSAHNYSIWISFTEMAKVIFEKKTMKTWLHWFCQPIM